MDYAQSLDCFESKCQPSIKITTYVFVAKKTIQLYRGILLSTLKSAIFVTPFDENA
jgi:hypothetical protein